MNPFNNKDIQSITKIFYNKFYNDNNPRKLILGINPGRLGAGATGIPFTDTKRLKADCKIDFTGFESHEPSSVFIYDVINAYGGPEKFYASYYINSVCPLGFLTLNNKGNWVNCNYYDFTELFKETKNFIIESLYNQAKFGIDTDSVLVLGKKNAKYLKLINDEIKLFKSIKVVDHPRYIVQYKSKEKDYYIKKYMGALSNEYTSKNSIK